MFYFKVLNAGHMYITGNETKKLRNFMSVITLQVHFKFICLGDKYEVFLEKILFSFRERDFYENKL